MSFIWPAMLFLLISVPLFVVLYVMLQRRRREIAARSGSLGLIQAPMGRDPGIRRYIPPALFLAGLTTLVISLARPQTVVHLPRVEGTVMLVFDVSGSMAAEDLEPNRMEAAKTAARSFVERQPSTMQIGVVAFSDNGFAVQAPTNEPETILNAINRLSPQRGTSLAHGIIASLNAIAAGKEESQILSANRTPEPTPSPTPVPEGTYTSAVIVLLTDGENNMDPDPFAAAEAARDRGVRIHTIGIGSTAGTLLHVEGFTVHTRLDEAMLQQISQISGGEYYNAQNEEDLLQIYDNLTPELVIRPEKTEVTSIFAGASIFILLIGGVFSLLWFNRLP